MTAPTDLVGPGKGIERDRYGRPLITPPGGGKPVPYTRCTTYVGVLEDTYNLSRWQMRMVAQGLAARPDLMLAVSALPLNGNMTADDKRTLNGLCEQAMEAASAHAAATVGTALHALAERHDRGETLGHIPDQYQPDINAYIAATAHLEMVSIETFGVHDGLRIGGTWDRIVRIDGQNYIADIKTGSIEWGIGKIAMQLAVYSRCHAYDPDTAQRTPLNVHQDRALIIHLPAGKGTAELVWVDIAAGWQAVDLARQVREWRARKDLTRPYVQSTAAATDAGTEREAAAALHLAIDAATSVDELNHLWATHQAIWTDAHTAAAAAKKTSLTATAA